MPRRAISILILGLLLQACASVEQSRDLAMEVPPFANAGIADDSGLPPVDGFLAVDDAMREFVRNHLVPVADPLERLRLLSSALFDPAHIAISYDGDRTLTARETFRLRTGNCLSFTALTVVLAREAGLEASFEDVPVLPQWRASGTAFIIERHVNAVMSVGSREFVLDFGPPVVATYASAQKIGDPNATAQYFGNLGVERFTAGDLEGAYRLFRRGLEVDPRAAPLWLNLGVVLARNGQSRQAEEAYRNTLALDPGNLSALNNLALLLQRRGDAAGARRLFARVERHRRSNPYYLYWLGARSLEAGEPAKAARSFEAAVEKMPAESEFHFALARAYLNLGRDAEAEASFEAALERAASDSIRERYQLEFGAASPARP